ncbi:MAG: MBL fold metallo-hydrolase, partial [Rhodoglobus sp.]
MKVDSLPPFGDEIILLVMGPGYGESVLVRWPPDCWLVVDSFRRVGSNHTELHPAADALRTFGERADAVALTHPHEDHTLGFATLVESRKPGGLVGWWPDLATEGRWDTPNPDRAAKQGTTEHAIAAINRVWTDEPNSRWDLQGDSVPRQVGGAAIRVLAPLLGTITHNQGLKKPDVNEMSSAMVVTWENCELLLGADLVNVRGWNDLAAAPHNESFTVVSGVKIAHHGSMEAQHPIAIGSPPAGSRVFIATPFNKQKLPRFEVGGGVDHLLGATDRLLLTSHWGQAPTVAASTDSVRSSLH